MKLDLTSFTKAVSALASALEERERQPQNDFIRDAVIQRFEFTFELSHKTLRRFMIAHEATVESVMNLSVPGLIRLASERGLTLNGWDSWSRYRDARNETSHTYDQKVAEAVASIAKDFYDDVRYLHEKMTQRLPQL